MADAKIISNSPDVALYFVDIVPIDGLLAVDIRFELTAEKQNWLDTHPIDRASSLNLALYGTNVYNNLVFFP